MPPDKINQTPCIEVATKNITFDIPNPVISEDRIFPKELLNKLLNFKLVIVRSGVSDTSNDIDLNICYDTPEVYRDNDLYEVVEQFTTVLNKLFKPILDIFEENNNHELISKDLFAQLVYYFQTFENDMEEQHDVNVRQWMQTHFGELPTHVDKLAIEYF